MAYDQLLVALTLFEEIHSYPLRFGLINFKHLSPQPTGPVAQMTEKNISVATWRVRTCDGIEQH
jgi:hypothetical protein